MGKQIMLGYHAVEKETEKCMMILGNDELFRLTDFGPGKKYIPYFEFSLLS
ncbi:MAG: hypothetical protein GY820_11355 [Gammaproteobacteria bacterium]|nr:hypothetical protein [Gammaproteobacteria bacterium]